MSKKKPLTEAQLTECQAANSLFLAKKNQLKLSQKKIADLAGISAAAVAMYLNGTNPLNAKFASILSGLLEEPVEKFSPRLAKEIALITQGAVSAEHKEKESNVTLASQPDRYFRYPVVSSVVAGGWGDAVQPYEPGAEDRSELSDYKARGRAFWLEVDGDSMTAPSGQSIPEGMLILVDTGIEAQPGHLVVAKLDSEEKATFKKLVSDAGQLYLKPLNPAYRMIPINGNCRIIGVVKEAKMKL